MTDPGIVINKARELLGPDVIIDFSTRQDKKYMILNPVTNKWVHFGQEGYEDFTYHQDPIRRHRFKIRNRKWALSKPYTPSYLSYYLLW